jgi:hypothetical protein
MTSENNDSATNHANILDVAVKEEREILAKEQKIRDEIKSLENQIEELKKIRFDKTRDYCKFFDYGNCIFSGTCSHKSKEKGWFNHYDCWLYKDAFNVIYEGKFSIYKREVMEP